MPPDPITIEGGPVDVTLAASANPSWGKIFIRDPSLDITIDVSGYVRSIRGEDRYPKITKLLVGAYGTLLNDAVWPNAATVTLSVLATLRVGVLVSASPTTITLGLSSDTTYTQGLKKSWVKWSKVGYLDFTIDNKNQAGERPLDWKGWIYEIKQLGDKVIVYGENGVSILTPSNNTFGLNTIYRIGLKGKQAVAGDESTHYFIDKENSLYSLGESLVKLDYSEYLADLMNPVLNWDLENRLLYICDGVSGFIYSPDSKSLGVGPATITGIGYQGGVAYVVSPSTIVTPTFEIWSDIYDMGRRRGKGIESLEFGVDLTIALKAAVRYRLNKSVPFSQTDWKALTSEGVAYIQCYGHEFQFGAKADSYQYFELDYIKVNGKVYDLW
jgi:hypothetical protein